MWSQLLSGLLTPPQVINPNTNQEKPDYTLVVISVVALVVILVLIFSLRKK
jgi:LPXTG-motif cell wall-anchored protein